MSMANMSWPLRVPLSYGRALNALVVDFRTHGDQLVEAVSYAHGPTRVRRRKARPLALNVDQVVDRPNREKILLREFPFGVIDDADCRRVSRESALQDPRGREPRSHKTTPAKAHTSTLHSVRTRACISHQSRNVLSSRRLRPTRTPRTYSLPVDSALRNVSAIQGWY